MTRSRLIVVGVVMMLASLAPATGGADDPVATSIQDILPPTYRLSKADRLVLSGTLVDGGDRFAYYYRAGDEVRTANLATGGRRTLGPTEGDFIDIASAPVGRLLAYARTDGFSPIRRAAVGGGPVDSTSVTSRNFAIGYRGAVLFTQGDETWYWDLDGSEISVTGGQVNEGAGSPDSDVFVYRDFDDNVRVVTGTSDESAGVLSAPVSTTAAGIEYTWLGDSVLLGVAWASGDQTIWFVDTAAKTSREIGVGTVVYATPTRVVFTDQSGAGHLGFLDEVRSPVPLGSIQGFSSVWAASDDFIVGTDSFTRIDVFSWDAVNEGTLDVAPGEQISELLVSGDTVVSVQDSVYSQDRNGGPLRQISPSSLTRVWDTGVGPDGWVYWVAGRGAGSSARFAIYRSMLDGRERMRLTKWKVSRFEPLAGDAAGSWMFGLDGTVLVYEFDGERGYWGLDLSDVSSAACYQLPATLVGTPGKDVIVGTEGWDVIEALGGDDIVRGRDGDDRICLGGGDDYGAGNAGDDRIQGNGGDDEMLGHTGDDRLKDPTGSNQADGGSGIDWCVVTGIVTGCELPEELAGRCRTGSQPPRRTGG